MPSLYLSCNARGHFTNKQQKQPWNEKTKKKLPNGISENAKLLRASLSRVPYHLNKINYVLRIKMGCSSFYNEEGNKLMLKEESKKSFFSWDWNKNKCRRKFLFLLAFIDMDLKCGIASILIIFKFKTFEWHPWQRIKVTLNNTKNFFSLITHVCCVFWDFFDD